MPPKAAGLAQGSAFALRASPRRRRRCSDTLCSRGRGPRQLGRRATSQVDPVGLGDPERQEGQGAAPSAGAGEGAQGGSGRGGAERARAVQACRVDLRRGGRQLELAGGPRHRCADRVGRCQWRDGREARSLAVHVDRASAEQARAAVVDRRRSVRRDAVDDGRVLVDGG